MKNIKLYLRITYITMLILVIFTCASDGSANKSTARSSTMQIKSDNNRERDLIIKELQQIEAYIEAFPLLGHENFIYSVAFSCRW